MSEKNPRQEKETDINKVHSINRGFYKGVKISIKTLDILIVAGMAAVVLLILFGMKNGGYHITYNSMGGSDVAYQKAEFGQTIEFPEAPERQGYAFEGWSLSSGCEELYVGGQVSGDMELFACWSAN